MPVVGGTMGKGMLRGWQERGRGDGGGGESGQEGGGGGGGGAWRRRWQLIGGWGPERGGNGEGSGWRGGDRDGEKGQEEGGFHR